MERKTDDGKRTLIEVSAMPTVASPEGTYIIIRDGIFWGHFYVGSNWAGEKFIARADPRDGFPY